MSGCCSALAGKFDAEYVARELAARRRRGPGRTATLLSGLVAARAQDLRGASLLDVGAGFGDVTAGLLARGVGQATHVEASPSYSEAARELAREGGWADRVRFESGDFVEVGDRLPDADIVTLDRVICCYDDMPALLDRSAARARSLVALSAPRSRWPVRLFVWLENQARRFRRDPFRTFVHSWPEMEARLGTLGFEPAGGGGTVIWRIGVYRRLTR